MRESASAALGSISHLTGFRHSKAPYCRKDTSLWISHGKGDKPRIVYLSDSAVRRVARWLELRPGAADDYPLFCPVNKAGRVADRRLIEQATYNMIEKRRTQAGIKAFSNQSHPGSFPTQSSGRAFVCFSQILTSDLAVSRCPIVVCPRVLRIESDRFA
jgi:hypothetical protein